MTINNQNIENLAQMLEYASSVDASPSPALVADVRAYIEFLEKENISLKEKLSKYPCPNSGSLDDIVQTGLTC